MPRHRRPFDRQTVLELLRHSDCPWGARPWPGRPGWIDVDPFLAFAWNEGVAIRGLEPFADEIVRSIGGRRIRGRIPRYEIPSWALGACLARLDQAAAR